MKVFVLGVIPPPIGGVSVHVKRFFDFCNENSTGIEIAIFDYKKKKVFFGPFKKGIHYALWFFLRSNIVHIHISSGLKVFALLVSKLFLKKVVYTHHNSIVSNPHLFRFMCKYSDEIVLVNSENISESIGGINSKKKVHEVPAFIPKSHKASLPLELLGSLGGFGDIISTNCSSGRIIDDEEVYGISRLVAVFQEAASGRLIENTALLICDPSRSYNDCFNWSSLYNLKNGNGVIYWSDDVDFSEVICRSTCTVRATITDGDSLSVRESLYYKVPVIASDVVKRPQGTVLYRVKDDLDLMHKIVATLKGQCVVSTPHKNFAYDIIDIYYDLGK
ncbi:glycosyltransferase family 4 protein [Marinobacter vulgaris]|nr:glycosyltransferase family 4 protein [Marinobacter vulgaris]TSJ66679.1 glycosyltransferase family 4 protein [Marinobacter vulgaris]